MNEQAVIAALYERIQEMGRAIVAQDLPFLQQLWSDDYVFTTPTGLVLTKAQRLAYVNSGARPLAALTYDQLQAKKYEQTVVVTGRYSETKLDGTPGEQGRWTIVFVEQNGQWQIVATHNSRLE